VFHIDQANRIATIENTFINPNIKATDETMKNSNPNIQPLPVSILPIFLSLPCLVIGIPVNLENLCLAELIPSALFHENEKPYVFLLLIVNLHLAI